MKPFLTALALLSLPASLHAIDQVFLEPSLPVSAALEGQGGASTANAEGWDGLWANPASVAVPQIRLTLLSGELSFHVPLSGISEVLETRSGWDELSMTSPLIGLAEQYLATTGLGLETSFGFGWTGANLGLGASAQARTVVRGTTALSASVVTEATVQGIVAFGWPFPVAGGTLRLGGDLRPFQRIHSLVTVVDALDATTDLSAYTVNEGFGLGWDIGARWDSGPFRVGLALRDIGGTVVGMKTYSLTEVAGAFGLPSGGTEAEALYRVPTVIGLGASWKPDLGSLGNLVRTRFALDLQIPIQDQYTQPSFWTWTHVGAEAEFLKFLAVRAGINQGWPSFGLGFRLWVWEVDVAVTSDELGRYSGTERRPSVILQSKFTL